MRPKTFYVSQPLVDGDPWAVQCEGLATSKFVDEPAAVAWARNRAEALWHNTGISSRVLLQQPDGEWHLAGSVGLAPPSATAPR